jgi:hypothetical protein
MDKKLPRWWVQSKDKWDPRWWNKIGWPFFGIDEDSRMTVTVGFWFLGYITFVTKTCQCEDCVDDRTHAQLREQYGDDFADDWLDYQVRMRGVSGSGTPRV